MSTPLTVPLLNHFLELAGNRLSGDWVLIGGTVLPILGVEHRATVDIDLVSVMDTSTSETLKLMSIAEELALPIEAINQAGSFFLNRIPHFRKHLVLLHQGKKATIYRPDATLFLRLKVERMSETDLNDCVQMLKYARRNRENLNRSLIEKTIESQICKSDQERRSRLNQLLEALTPRKRP